MLIGLDEIYRIVQTVTSYLFHLSSYNSPKRAKSNFFDTFAHLTLFDKENNIFQENYGPIHYRIEFSINLSLCIFVVSLTLKMLWRSEFKQNWEYVKLANLLHYFALTISFRVILRPHSDAESLVLHLCLRHVFSYLEPLKSYSQSIFF